MTARPSRLQAVLFGDEASFAEASPTIDTRLEVASRVDLAGLSRDQLDAGFVGQYGSEGYRNVRGPHMGSFSVTCYLTGHGTDPGTGALTATDLYTLLGYCLGGTNAASDGTTADGTGSVTVPGVAANTMVAGTGARIGAIGDGDGNGQFYWITATAATPTITLHNALAGTLVNGAQVSPALTLHPVELPASMTDITSVAFRVQTGNRQYDLHGCHCTGISFSNLTARQVPTVTLTFGVAWWEVTNNTFPSATASNAKTPAPVAEGSFWINGSSTYNTECLRSFDLTIDHSVFVQESSCGDQADSVVSGVKYGPSIASIRAVIDAEASGTTTWLDFYEADTALRALYTLSSDGGKAVGFNFQNLKWINKPRQIENNGLNAIELNMRACIGSTVSSDILAANWHLFMG